MLAGNPQLHRNQWQQLVCWSDNDADSEGDGGEGKGDGMAGELDSNSTSAARAQRRSLLRRQLRASMGRHDPFLPRHSAHALNPNPNPHPQQQRSAAAASFLAPTEQEKAAATEARRAAAAATPLGRIGFALELVQHSLADMAGSEESSGTVGVSVVSESVSWQTSQSQESETESRDKRPSQSSRHPWTAPIICDASDNISERRESAMFM